MTCLGLVPTGLFRRRAPPGEIMPLTWRYVGVRPRAVYATGSGRVAFDETGGGGSVRRSTRHRFVWASSVPPRRAPAGFRFVPISRRTVRYSLAMPVLGIVEDILALDDLVVNDDDAARRETLLAVRNHIAQRDQGAKVADAAEVLGVSQPTVRSWLDAGILRGVVGARPIRIELLALANVKGALDAIRMSADDGPRLVQVHRVLRDRAASAGVREGLDDFRSGKARAIGDDLRGEITTLRPIARRAEPIGPNRRSAETGVLRRGGTPSD